MLEAPKRCGLAPIRGTVPGRGIVHNPHTGRRRAKGVNTQQCRSQTCVECAQRAGQQLATDIQRVTNEVLKMGGTLAHSVFDFSHNRGQRLGENADALQVAFAHMWDSSDVKDLQSHGVVIAIETSRARASYELPADHPRKIGQLRRNFRVEQAKLRPAGTKLIAYVRAFECTWGCSAGYHPHFHVLFFFDGPVTEAQGKLLRNMLFRRYKRGLELSERTATKERGLTFDLASTREEVGLVLGNYLGKLALEVGRSVDKKPKLGKDGEIRWTPYSILETLARQDEFAEADRLDEPTAAQFRAVWAEFEEDTKGMDRVTHGGMWAELLERSEPLPERPEDVWLPAELPEGAPENAEGISFPDADNYAKSLVPLMREFDWVCEGWGYGAAVEWLDAHSIVWIWALPPDDPSWMTEWLSKGDPPF